MFKKLFFAVGLQCVIGGVLAQASTGILVSVNGTKITSSQLNEWVDYVVAEGGGDTPELRERLLKDIVLREAIMQDAKKSGLINSPKNLFAIKVAQQNTVMELWFMQYFKAHPITDADVRAEYDAQLEVAKNPLNSKEYQVSQIVVPTEAEASQLISQIKAGAQFEDLAKAKSMDKASGQRGGIMGWLLPSQLAEPIRDIMVGMTVGQVAEKPIQVKGFWHVVRVDNIKPFVVPSFDQVKPAIAQEIAEQRRQDAINALMKGVKITQSN